MHEHTRLAIRTLILVLMITIVAPAATPGLEKPAQVEGERFRALAVMMGYLNTGAKRNIDIVISRWTTPEEHEALLEALMAGNQNAFRQALARQEITGWMRWRNGPRYEFRYAWVRSQREDGSREIILATNQITPFGRASNRLETSDDQSTLIEMELDASNEGSRIAAVAIKFKVESNNLAIESFGAQPVNLNDIRRTE